MNDYEGDQPQEYEQIPWSHLVPVQKDRSIQLAMMVAVIAAALLAIVFFMRRGQATPVVAASAAPTTVVVQQPIVSSPPAAPVATGPASAAIAGPQIYSEADLMAALPPQPELAAIARAEWFVTDYFTVDGDASLADALMASLPDVVDLPTTDGSAISYVEWARAVAVDDHRDGTYVVTVWFRTLVGNADGGFDRTAVRAVGVHLVTDASGRLAIADLPVAAAVDPVGVAPAWPVDSPPPADAVAQASAGVGVLGDSPELLAAGVDDAGWRFVFSVGDASGLRFPVVVRVPATGR